MFLKNDISDSDYAELEGINFSSFKHFFNSPSYFRWASQQVNEETDDLIIGSAVHTAVLQPDKFKQKYCVAPKLDRRKTEHKLIWNEFVESNKHKIALTAEMMDVVVGCTSAIRDNKYFKSIFNPNHLIEAGGNAELFGSVIKGRIDYYNPELNVIFDIKTCSIVPNINKMRKQAEDRMHYMQGFFYRHIIAENFKLRTPPDVVFGYVNKKSPNQVGLLQFHDLYFQKAAIELEPQLMRFENCKASGVWPESDASVNPQVVKPWSNVVDTEDEADESE